MIGWHTNADARRTTRGIARRALVVLLMLGLSTPPAALGEGPQLGQAAAVSSTLQDKLRTPGDLTLRDTPLGEALFTISETWEVNLVVGHEVEGRVNGVFKAAPLQEVLDSILLSNGYGYRPVGRSLVVMKLDKLGELNPMFERVTIPVSGNLDDILPALKLLSSPQGKIQPIASAGSIFVVDYPDRVAMIEDFLEKLAPSVASNSAGTAVADVGLAGPPILAPMQVLHFRPQFVAPLAFKEPVQNMLTVDGKVAIMEADKQVVVLDHADNVLRIERVLRELDIPRPQVRITAMIYDISLENLTALGINWNNALKGRVDAAGDPQSVLSLDSIVSVPAAAGAPSTAISFMNLSRHLDLEAVIHALNQQDQNQLLADPNVTVEDNETAQISIVTEIPYQQLTQTSQGGNIGTTAFREAGIKLKVVPHIAIDGTIRLEVNPEFSRLAGYTSGEQPQPIIDKREVQAVVRVADRQTLVIGGLRSENDSNRNTGIPYLQDLKWVGPLFRSKRKSNRKSELVVFITTEVLSPLPCLTPRQHAAQDTINYQLEQIPSAPILPLSPPTIVDPHPTPVFEGNCPVTPQDGVVPEGREVILPRSEEVPRGPVLEGPRRPVSSGDMPAAPPPPRATRFAPPPEPTAQVGTIERLPPVRRTPTNVPREPAVRVARQPAEATREPLEDASASDKLFRF